MDFPLWALSLKTFHNTQSPSETFWSRHFWGCHVYARWRAHGQMRKGKTGSRGILRSWYHRWGLQDNTGKGEKTKHKPKIREWNKCRTKTTDTTVRAQQQQLQISSTPMSGQSYPETRSWLFASLKPSARTDECFLFNGKLPKLHRNNPK